MKLMLVVGLPLTLVAVAIVAVWLFSLGFASHIDDLRMALVTSQKASSPVRSELPPIVRSYAVRAGGRVGAPSLFHARQEAALSTDRNRPPIEVQADQWTGTVVSGIVWSARGTMGVFPVAVVDAFVDGRGELSARVLGTIQVAGGRGADFDKGELQRYLSELPIYPDAILNNSGLSWRQIDERTVEVTGQSRSGPASLRFIFDEHGDIVRSEADSRPMSRSDGTTVPTPWHGTFGDYQQFGRYRVPAYGEVGWMMEDGLFTYWRGRLVSYEPVNGS